MSIPESTFNKLTASIDWSQSQLSFARAQRVSAIKQFAGSHYAEGGAQLNVPVSVLKLAVDIYVRTLAPRMPRVLVTTVDRSMKPAAAKLELALNLIPDEIKLSDTLRRVVTEALFAFGIVKIGLHTTGEMLGHNYGEPFVDSIDLDDYFIDMTAKHLDLIQYEGNDYYPTLEEVMESDRFKKGKTNGLDDEADSNMNELGEARAGSITSDSAAEEYKKRIKLRDVWVPGEGLLHTYAVKSKRLLGTIEWEGPERGMYRKLGFSNVPGNLLPLPPVSMWRDLHELSNALFRKLGRQADGQKSCLGFQGNNEDEITAFKAARDGDGILYKGPKPEKLEVGGVSTNTLAFYQVCRELSSYFSGNLDALGGLAPMTETVGQDKLLTESASAQMRDMSGRTVDFVRDVFKDLAFYEWNDPVKSRTLERPIPGMPGVKMPVVWDKSSRTGDFDSLDLDIDVYSLQDDSPGLKLQRLGFIMQTYIGPLMPEIQRQGGQVDAKGIIEIVTKLADFPELANIVTFVESDTQSGAAPGAPPTPGAGGGQGPVSAPVRSVPPSQQIQMEEE